MDTFYYIGTSTRQSSIMRVFPAWAELLGISKSFIGINCKIHDDPEVYRKIVSFIKNDKKSLGALVTSHKIDLYQAATNIFDEIGDYTKLLKEVSCISKKDGKLWGHAKDPITSGLAFESFIPKNHWKKTNAEIFIIGAGGASLALTTYIMQELTRDNLPSKIYVANRSQPRLSHMKAIHKKINPGIRIEYLHHPNKEQNDPIVNQLKLGSLVINGTGLGKDIPGSPLTEDVLFPKNGFAWDYNYRGDLLFLKQARSQQKERNLHVEDGWVYFLHGWIRVIAEVFHINIPTEGPQFQEISDLASKVR
ncbi:MAG: shikimate dehydrogenase [Candidatus Lokiarchaeota archaeon]|nr:shikimate dehydrogenase [Candidatus Lokiarchaeota archaeon]MBD3201840.1 shikimate dehydrogenase [Candidatus Lokiarchaeota archaeon]